MDKHVVISILLFICVDSSVIFAFFLPEWIITDVGGEVRIGLWQTCIQNRSKGTKCFITNVPFEWKMAIAFIASGCTFATLTVVALMIALKMEQFLSYGRWLGMFALACLCIAAVFIPMGFHMDPIKGEPFQLPSSYYVRHPLVLRNTFFSNSFPQKKTIIFC